MGCSMMALYRHLSSKKPSLPLVMSPLLCSNFSALSDTIRGYGFFFSVLDETYVFEGYGVRV